MSRHIALLAALQLFIFTSVAVSSKPNQDEAARKTFPIRVASGVVVDHQGNPVESAMVCYVQWEGSKRSNVIERTDKNGRFSIKYRSTRKFDGLFTWVLAKGHGVRTVRMANKFKGAKGQERPVNIKNVEIQLPKLDVYEIVVNKPNGDPLPDVRVHVSMAHVPNGRFAADTGTGLIDKVPTPISRFLTTGTDEEGKAVLKGIPRQLADKLAVSSTEFGTQNLSLKNQESTFQVQEVGSISGAVNAEDIAPYIGMKIYLQTDTPGQGYAEAFVDEAGKFEVKAMAPGDLTIDVVWPKGADIYPWLQPRHSVNVFKKLQLETVSAPSKMVTVTGQVLRSDSRAPADNVTIILQDDRGRSGTMVDTDSSGTFSAKVCTGSVSWQIISLTGHHHAYNYPTPGRVTFEIPGDTDESFELDPILLPVKPTLKGRVVDVDGKPLTDANIVICDNAYAHTSGSAKSDTEGQFEMKVNHGWKSALEEGGKYFAIRIKSDKETELPKFEKLDLLNNDPQDIQLQQSSTNDAAQAINDN